MPEAGNPMKLGSTIDWQRLIQDRRPTAQR